MTMTPLQERALTIIENLLSTEEFAPARSWLYPSRVMTHIQVESSWDPSARSADGFGSIGLMQVLASTAAQMGVKGSMLQPENAILAGMRYLVNCHKILQHHRDHPEITTFTLKGEVLPIDPAIYEGALLDYRLVCSCYNMGIGNALVGRKKQHYLDQFAKFYPTWLPVDIRLGVVHSEAPTTVLVAPKPAPAPAETKPAEGGLVRWLHSLTVRNEDPPPPAVRIAEEPVAAAPAPAAPASKPRKSPAKAEPPASGTSADELNAAEAARNSQDPAVQAALAAADAIRKG